MLVKVVIRLDDGYFDLKDNFFLIEKGKSGGNLKEINHNRIKKACLGLKNELSIDEL